MGPAPNPEDRFSHNEAHKIVEISVCDLLKTITHSLLMFIIQYGPQREKKSLQTKFLIS